MRHPVVFSCPAPFEGAESFCRFGFCDCRGWLGAGHLVCGLEKVLRDGGHDHLRAGFGALETVGPLQANRRDVDDIDRTLLISMGRALVPRRILVALFDPTRILIRAEAEVGAIADQPRNASTLPSTFRSPTRRALSKQKSFTDVALGAALKP